jgi:hypothetical protein
MATAAYEALEEIYPEIVELMAKNEFDSHEFILKIAQKYQKLYIQALYEHRDQNRPFHRVHMAIAKRLKNHTDLVKQIDSKPSPDIFGHENKVAIWQRVK